MSLPAGQQRVLRGMEDALQASEPRLASMFAMFAQLNGKEPVRAESLRRGPGRPLYALVAMPLMLAAIVGALVGGVAHGAACGSGGSAGGRGPLVTRSVCALPAKSTVGDGAASP